MVMSEVGHTSMVTELIIDTVKSEVGQNSMVTKHVTAMVKLIVCTPPWLNGIKH